MKGSERIILVALPLIALAVGFWLLVLAPKQKQAGELQDRIDGLNGQVESAEVEIAAAEKARSDFPSDYADLVTLGTAIPEEDDQATLVHDLTTIGRQNNVSFRSFTLAEGAGSAPAPAPAPAPTEPSSGSTESSDATGRAGGRDRDGGQRREPADRRHRRPGGIAGDALRPDLLRALLRHGGRIRRSRCPRPGRGRQARPEDGRPADHHRRLLAHGRSEAGLPERRRRHRRDHLSSCPPSRASPRGRTPPARLPRAWTRRPCPYPAPPRRQPERPHR